jgi:hypothetical protein
MKKVILTLILGVISLSHQAQSFHKNDLVLSAGSGRTIFKSAGWDSYKLIPGFSSNFIQPLTIKAEFAITNEIGLGLSSVYSSATAQWSDSNYNYRSSYNKLSVTPRLNIHFLKNKVVDMYLGGGIGYKTGAYQFDSNDPNLIPSTTVSVIPISLEASLGIRAFFTPEFGGFAELGIGHGFFQFGLSYKPLVNTRN